MSATTYLDDGPFGINHCFYLSVSDHLMRRLIYTFVISTTQLREWDVLSLPTWNHTYLMREIACNEFSCKFGPSSRKQPPEVLFSLGTTSRKRPLKYCQFLILLKTNKNDLRRSKRICCWKNPKLKYYEEFRVNPAGTWHMLRLILTLTTSASFNHFSRVWSYKIRTNINIS